MDVGVNITPVQAICLLHIHNSQRGIQLSATMICLSNSWFLVVPARTVVASYIAFLTVFLYNTLSFGAQVIVRDEANRGNIVAAKTDVNEPVVLNLFLNLVIS